MDILKNPHLCTRLGRSKNHIAKSLFRENHYPNQQKGRRVPLHLQEKVEQELDKLINDKQIVRLEKCPDDVFISLHLIDAVALHISERKASPEMYWFSKNDLKYAYSQIPLDESIAKH